MNLVDKGKQKVTRAGLLIIQNWLETLRVHLFGDGLMNVGATNKRNEGHSASSQLLEGGPFAFACHLHRAQQSRGEWEMAGNLNPTGVALDAVRL